MEVSKCSAEATVEQLLFNCEYLLITNCKFFSTLTINRSTNIKHVYTIIRYWVDRNWQFLNSQFGLTYLIKT